MTDSPRRRRPTAAALLVAALLLAPPAACQDYPPPADQEAARKLLLDTMAAAGIRLDLEAMTVTIDATVAPRTDLIEYVLINKRGKAHEALLFTDVKPSLLNAALLALGYEPGTNVTWKEKDPLPTEEEVRAGAEWVTITPPQGQLLWMTVSWTPEQGPPVQRAVEDLLVDLTTGEALADAEWVFLGGRVAPPYRGDPAVFLADLQGNMVSTCYLDPANHLVTIRHERGGDDQNWWFHPDCPASGTELKLTFHRHKPDVIAAREKRIADERAAGKQPQGPPDELPAQPASGDRPPGKRKDG